MTNNSCVKCKKSKKKGQSVLVIFASCDRQYHKSCIGINALVNGVYTCYRCSSAPTSSETKSSAAALENTPRGGGGTGTQRDQCKHGLTPPTPPQPKMPNTQHTDSSGLPSASDSAPVTTGDFRAFLEEFRNSMSDVRALIARTEKVEGELQAVGARLDALDSSVDRRLGALDAAQDDDFAVRLSGVSGGLALEPAQIVQHLLIKLELVRLEAHIASVSEWRESRKKQGELASGRA